MTLFDRAKVGDSYFLPQWRIVPGRDEVGWKRVRNRVSGDLQLERVDQSINGQERETFEEYAFERWGMESMDGGAIGEEEKWAKV